MGMPVDALDASLLVFWIKRGRGGSGQLRALVVHRHRLRFAEAPGWAIDGGLARLLIVVVGLSSSGIDQLDPRHPSIYYDEKTSSRRSGPSRAPVPCPAWSSGPVHARARA